MLFSTGPPILWVLLLKKLGIIALILLASLGLIHEAQEYLGVSNNATACVDVTPSEE